MSKNSKLAIFFFGIVFIISFSTYFTFQNAKGDKKSELTFIKYSKFSNYLKDGKIKSVVDFSNSDKDLLIKLKNGKYLKTDNPQYDGFKMFLLKSGIEIEKKSTSSEIKQIFILLLQLSLPILIFIIAVYFIMGKLMKKQYSTDKNLFQIYKDPNVTFEDVAGNEEAKENMGELVQFLRSPKLYKEFGIVPPKGTVLYGPPGTGKTLLAKALAGTSKVAFISVSGSDFVEKFVGVGASRIRNLFQLAKKNKPCILFIDEIDALGKRGGDSGSNSERDQTLNQILVEIDGFSGSEGIIVIAATNRLDMIDSALLRSGRFDRQIRVDLPDIDARKEILKIHSMNKPLSKDIDLGEVAKSTVYMSGADLSNVMNEAGIYAIRNKNTEITMKDIDLAITKIHAGEEKKNRKNISIRDKEITAYHEAGHALAAKLLSGITVSKVTIIPTTKGAGGYTVYQPDEKMFSTKKELFNAISMYLGGRAAEEIIYSDDGITNGASHDLKKATEIASNMVNNYGMSDSIGLVSFSVYLNGNDPNRHDIVEHEVKLIIEKAYKETLYLLKENKDCLINIAKVLLDKETIYRKDIDDIVEGTLWKR